MPIPKEDYWIRPKLNLMEYQLRVFTNELKKEQKAYDKLVATIPDREKSYKPKFKTMQELEQAYLEGLLDNDEWIRQRGAVWSVYSDRGHIERIKWLKEQVEEYQGRLDLFNEYLEKRHKERMRKYDTRKRLHSKHGKTQTTIDKMSGRKKEIEQERKDQRAKRKRSARNKRYVEKKKRLKELEEMYKDIRK